MVNGKEKMDERVREKYEKSRKYQASFDDVGNRYSLRNPFGFYFEYRKFSEMVKLLNYAKVSLKDKKILDVGCHRGYQLNNLVFLKGNSKDTYGVDFIPSFINEAKNLNPGIDFKVMDFYNLDFKEEYFDFVTLFYVINCMPIQDRAKIIGSISNKVKKGGYVLVFEHSDNSIINFIRKVVKKIKGEKSSYVEYANDFLVKRYFKGFELIKSKRIINVLSPKLCKVLPNFLVEMFDYIIPNNYYITLLRKV